MPSRPKFVDIRSYARKFTVEALETLAHVMRQPKAPPAARVMAANALLDRGWGKAAQLVAVDGEITRTGNNNNRQCRGTAEFNLLTSQLILGDLGAPN